MKIVLTCIIIPSLMVQFAFALNAIITKFDLCEPSNKNSRIQAIMSNIKHRGDFVHVADLSAFVGLDVGDNTRYRANLYKNGRKLPISFNGKNGCKALESIFGEVYADVVKAAKMTKGCPLKQGNYTGKSIEMDLKKIKLQLPIKGKFQVKINVDDAATNDLLGCAEILAELK